MQQTGNGRLNYYFSDLTVPREINDMLDKIRYYAFQLKNNNITVIFDHYVFNNTIKEINYYYKRGLIKEKELFLIKKDIANMINFAENLSQTGVSKEGSKYHFYLSTFNIDSNTIYTEFDLYKESQIWVNTINPIVIGNQEISFIQKQWLNSLKRYSTLISQSNEICQFEFFSEQREYLGKIAL
jgi:hypothetical protein